MRPLKNGFKNNCVDPYETTIDICKMRHQRKNNRLEKVETMGTG